FASGMRLEVISPHRVDENDFLHRFIGAHGPRGHHLTFRVDDLETAMAQLERSGFPILYSNADNPEWREAFIHPRDACGVVVQIASWTNGWDISAVPIPQVDLATVDITVRNLPRALTLFGELLGGEVVEADDGATISWPGGGSIALSEGHLICGIMG